MPGSASNPVVLDPLQTITEVHWPSLFTHVAFAFTIVRQTSSISGGGFCSPVAEFLDQDTTYTDHYLTGLIYSAGPLTSSISTYRKGKWGGSNNVQFQASDSISGLPSASHSSGYGEWQYLGHNKGTGTFGPTIGQPLDVDMRIHGNKQVWQALSGSAAQDDDGKSISIVGSSINFTETSSATYESHGVTCLESEPVCRKAEGTFDAATLSVKIGSRIAGDTPFDHLLDGTSPVITGSSMTVDFSDVVATIGGRSFHQVGLGVPSSISAEPLKNVGAIYILLKVND